MGLFWVGRCVVDAFKQRYEQYKQFRGAMKSALPSVVLDTITTRFLLLFLFLLAIPLITVIIFTVSLLASHMDEAANNQLIFSQNLFDASIDTSQEKRLAREMPSHHPTLENEPCQGREENTLCLEIDYKQQRVQSNASPNSFSLKALPKQSPDIPLSATSPNGQHSVFARWQHQLYLMSQASSQAANSLTVLQGIPINNAFLNRLYRQQPNLQTEIWILAEPLSAATTQWLARSPQGPYHISEGALLNAIRKLNRKPDNQPVTLELNKVQYRLIQENLYSFQNERIARVLHILPLVQNQLLLNNYYLGIYAIAVASLIFSVLLAMLAGRTITQPLLRLVQQVNTLSRESVMKDSDVVTVSGVHEIRQLGEAFNRMIKRLRQEHTMKDEFVATLTHDLKVPLLAEKQTLSYFLKRTYGPLNDEQHEVLDIMQSSNQSCLSLVNGLLEVYRYDAGTVSLLLESFDLVQLMTETLNELQSLAREKTLTLTLQTDLHPDTSNTEPSAPAGTVYADRLEIKRMLHNLVSNAISNTPPHGAIACRITNTSPNGEPIVSKVSGFQSSTLKQPINLQDRLLVMVQDSGVGFSNEDLPNLFKQFAASRGRNPMSIGLGLYNCYQVVQAHNGVLWVESTEGEGSVVSFILPQSPKTAQDRRVYHDRRKQSR